MSPNIFDKVTSVFKAPARGDGSRPPFERLYPYVLAAFIGFLAADLLILAYRDRMLPTAAPPGKRPVVKMAERRERFDYERIAQRNMFNNDGIIPPPVGKKDQPEEQPLDNPVPSQLPLTLVGTIVHVNPARSIATIELKSQNKILPFVPNDEIEGLAKVLKIERKRCIFRNTNNNRLEYIEIKDDSPISFETNKKAATEAPVKQEGNNFSLKRDEVNNLINNLPEVLQQARAVPNIVPGSGGRVDGFRILDIAPGSIFEKLGLQRQDVIKEVNGQMVDSPARALELYNELKSAGSIQISIDRNGRKENFNYTIN
ncbi:MAG TPA: type II secretion system protein GspC [Bdellovibrionales bacterium]|nr:type II secretion system protein GspC [Bdellovibrionales bacterium]